MTPSEFHTQYYGWGKDIDGVAGIQCVDLFKEFLRIIGCPTYASPIGGDGYSVGYDDGYSAGYNDSHNAAQKILLGNALVDVPAGWKLVNYPSGNGPVNAGTTKIPIVATVGGTWGTNTGGEIIKAVIYYSGGAVNNNEPATGENGAVRTSWVGGSQPHNNMPPYYSMPFWIRTA